jgi:hypothetical protein
MITRLEIQSAIEQLPTDEIRNLSKWLQEYLDEKCDRQIESDVQRSHGKIKKSIDIKSHEVDFWLVATSTMRNVRYHSPY